MKKQISLLVILFLLGISSLVAQDLISVTGYVTNEANGNPVTNHEVFIMVNDSNMYYSFVNTDQNGFYVDTINTAGFVVNSLYIFINDLCTYGIHDTLIQNPGSAVNVDFEICVDTIVNPDCQAGFYYFPDSSDLFTYYFNDMSYSTYGIDSWYWDFGDGNTSTLQNPVHTYNAQGTYQVCLSITADSGSCTSTFCEYVLVNNGNGNGCTADFYYYPDSSQSYTMQFIDMSIPANDFTSYFWSFGDNNTSTLQNPVHTYPGPGLYTVCLTITSQDSGMTCTDTFCMDIMVGGGSDCLADFYYVYDSLGMNTNVVSFFDMSLPYGQIDSWFWDFGDGTSSSEQNPVHIFPSTGTFNVCLTITADSMSCSDTQCKNIVIYVNDNLQLSGNVFAGIYQLDDGFSYAYKLENNVITDVFAEMIDTLGYYIFYPMAAADYYVKVEPSPSSAYFGNYLPTYYGDVVSWSAATIINLTQNLYTADINLVEVDQGVFGPGSISGTIMHEGGNRDNIPAEGVQIMLRNEQGIYVGLAYSDVNGEFEFTSLSEGIYTLMAEVAGINMIPKDYVLSTNNMIVDDVSMIMNQNEIYFSLSSIDDLGDVTVSSIYPNPVSNILNLNIQLEKQSRLTVNILNQLGQIILQDEYLLENSRSLQINTSSLKSGIYFLEIISEGQYRNTQKFIKF